MTSSSRSRPSTHDATISCVVALRDDDVAFSRVSHIAGMTAEGPQQTRSPRRRRWSLRVDVVALQVVDVTLGVMPHVARTAACRRRCSCARSTPSTGRCCSTKPTRRWARDDSEQAKAVKDLAVAQQLFATRQKLGNDIIDRAFAIKTRALARLGELLAARQKAKGGQPYRRGLQRSTNRAARPVETLAELGNYEGRCVRRPAPT